MAIMLRTEFQEEISKRVYIHGSIMENLRWDECFTYMLDYRVSVKLAPSTLQHTTTRLCIRRHKQCFAPHTFCK